MVTRAFMEVYENTQRKEQENIKSAAEEYYVELVQTLAMEKIPVPDIPFFINAFRYFIVAFKLTISEAYEKAFLMLSEDELLKAEKGILKILNGEGREKYGS